MFKKIDKICKGMIITEIYNRDEEKTIKRYDSYIPFREGDSINLQNPDNKEAFLQYTVIETVFDAENDIYEVIIN